MAEMGCFWASMISSDVAPDEEELDALLSKVDLVRLCKWVVFFVSVSVHWSFFPGRLFLTRRDIFGCLTAYPSLYISV
jgi:hypothetical protein